METTLGGYSDAATAGEVRRFLAALPREL